MKIKKIELVKNDSFEIYFSMSFEEGMRGSEGCKIIDFKENNYLKFTWNISPSFKYQRASNYHSIVTIYFKQSKDNKIELKLMNELIKYIHEDKTYEEHLIVSHIIHYYLVYLHPYFDFNGRMARVLSFWYNYKYTPSLSLLLVSEAINNNTYKKGYYNAINNSRQMRNDITYFLECMSSIILKYSKVYINFYNVSNKLKGQGIILNRSTEIALKNVLALPSLQEQYFDWRDYKNFTNDDFTKQYYFKLLNELVELNVLLTKEHKNTKLFKLNYKYWDLM